jgi:AcrR family transcriptional regulator
MDRRKMEVRDRILSAAFDLFLSQGVSATTIEEICERADVANRTFFNHFPTRQDMMRALAESRLLNLHDVVVDRSDEPVHGWSGCSTTLPVRWSNPAIRIAK